MMQKVYAIQHFPGKPLVWGQITKPVPKPHEVLIKVAAAGVNRADLLQRQGHYPPPEGAIDRLGLEVSGVIEDVGSHVSRWKVGEKVCALLPSGGYAEYAVADEGSTLTIPAGISLTSAAALPETVITVWLNVFEIGKLQAGETILIQGGASGVGTMAIQMAKAFGARVFVTAGSDEKCEACLAIGADIAINYKKQDFEKELKDVGGVDVVLDMVAGEYVARHINILRSKGRLVHIAVQGGLKAEINILKIMSKEISLTGSTLRSRSVAEKARLASNVTEKVWPMLENGTIEPVIDAEFPLEDAENAHKRLTSGEHIGKILLKT